METSNIILMSLISCDALLTICVGCYESGDSLGTLWLWFWLIKAIIVSFIIFMVDVFIIIIYYYYQLSISLFLLT